MRSRHPQDRELAAKESQDEAVLTALAGNPELSVTAFMTLARRAPRLVADSHRLASMSGNDLSSWEDEAIAAVLTQPHAPESVLLHLAAAGTPLQRVARWVASPDTYSSPRDWAPDLLIRFAALASKFVEPLPAATLDWLGDAFHLHHRWSPASRLASCDLFAWSLADVRKLGRHKNADARVWSAISMRLEALFHAGDDDVSEELLDTARSRAADPEAPPASPPLLAQALADLLSGDEDTIRSATEKLDSDVFCHRLLAAPALAAIERRELLLTLVRYGFAWHRETALARLLSEPLSASELGRIAERVQRDELARFLADARLSPGAIATLWMRLEDRQYLIAGHPAAPRELHETRRDLVHVTAVKHTLDTGWLEEVASTTREGEIPWAYFLDNPGCPQRVLQLAARHEVADLRARAAGHSSLALSEQQLLAGDADEGVRICLGSNRRADPSVLDVLARDVSARVRKIAAWNPRTRLESLLALTTDSAAGVRKMAEGVAVFARVASWQPADQAFAALTRLSKPQRVATAARDELAPDAAAALARDADADVRAALAANPTAAARDQLTALSGDPATRVRMAIALRADTPSQTLTQLSRDRRRCVANAAERALELTRARR